MQFEYSITHYPIVNGSCGTSLTNHSLELGVQCRLDWLAGTICSFSFAGNLCKTFQMGIF